MAGCGTFLVIHKRGVAVEFLVGKRREGRRRRSHKTIINRRQNTTMTMANEDKVNQ